METLVAISLLLLAITGPMVFAQNGLRAAFQSRDQVTAFNLAQDAIEFIKNRRDHNILNATSDQWLANVYDECESGSIPRDGGCSIDTSTSDGTVIQCSFASENDTGCLGKDSEGLEDVPLKIDEDGVFGHTGDDSIFARTVFVDTVGMGEDEARVTVLVRWRSHENLGVREIEVVEYIRNWGSALGL